MCKILEYDGTAIGKFLGHLRYNLFLVFYPLGAFSDLMTTYNSAEKGSKFSYLMPNKMNVSFNYPYIATVVLPVGYVLIFPFIYKQLLA